MNRLTERVQRAKGDVVVYIGQQRAHEDADVPAEVTPRGVREILHRLAAYEDTGLEPEEVNAIKHAFMGREIAKITEFDGIPIQRVQELAQAEKDGRLVVLPCKVGDTVYMLVVRNGNAMMQDVEVKCIDYTVNIDFPSYAIGVALPDKAAVPFDLDEIGKTVFLTREAAEAALEGGAEHE